MHVNAWEESLNVRQTRAIPKQKASITGHYWQQTIVSRKKNETVIRSHSWFACSWAYLVDNSTIPLVVRHEKWWHAQAGETKQGGAHAQPRLAPVKSDQPESNRATATPTVADARCAFKSRVWGRCYFVSRSVYPHFTWIPIVQTCVETVTCVSCWNATQMAVTSAVYECQLNRFYVISI